MEVVFLESLKKKEGDHHHVIESLVGSEALEWHLLGSKFLESAVGQFVGATLVVIVDQAFVVQIRAGQIRHDDVIGPRKLQQPLLAVVLWSGIESPIGFLPFIASVLEGGMAPFLASIIVDLPFLLADGGHLLL